MRDDFPESVKRNLAKRVNYLCSNPKCRQLTSGPNHDENKSTSIGIAAHITAASKGGPRYDETLTQEERKSIKNGIWLCHNCSDLVDKDDKNFETETLQLWKTTTEEFVQEKMLKSEVSSESLFNELTKGLSDLNGSAKISEILPKLFEVSIIYNLPKLTELCTREMNGWYTSELPKLDEMEVPEYRAYQVYISLKDYNVSVLRSITPTDFFRELEKQEEVIKFRYLFHEPMKEIEAFATKFAKEEEQVMHQEINANSLNINGELLKFGTQIWFPSSIYASIESGLRKELNRRIIEKMKEFRF